MENGNPIHMLIKIKSPSALLHAHSKGFQMVTHHGKALRFSTATTMRTFDALKDFNMYNTMMNVKPPFIMIAMMIWEKVTMI